jgi:excisionase family DNA binding protein
MIVQEVQLASVPPSPKATELPLVLRAEEAAEIARVGERAIYEGCQRGEIPHRYLGRRLLIPRDAFLRWLDGSDA